MTNIVYQLPVQRRVARRPLHLGVPLGGRGVVGLGDGPLLRAERLRRVQLDLLERLRVGAAAGRQRVAHLDARERSARSSDERVRADVAGRAVAER